MSLDKTKKHSEQELLSESYFELKAISGGFGSVPVATGAQTINEPALAFEAWEATTFGVFKNQKGDEITNHPWKGKSLFADKLASFGPDVATFTITAGGLGQYVKSGEEIVSPALVSAALNALGTKIILTFDRTMSNPASYAADFTSTLQGVANVVTAAALGSNTKTIELTLTTTAVAEDVATVSIASGNITSVWGGVLPAVTNHAVTNPIV